MLTLSEKCCRALPKHKMLKTLLGKDGIKHGCGPVLSIFACVHMHNNRIKIQCDLRANKTHKLRENIAQCLSR